MRITNRSGRFDDPVQISVPDRNESITPNASVIPFSTINIYARKEDYEEIYMQNIQVFPNVITSQPLQLIPLAEFPGSWNKAEDYNTPPQNL